MLVVQARQDLQKFHSHVCAHDLVIQDGKHCCPRAPVFVVVVTPVVLSVLVVVVEIVVVVENVTEAVTVEMLSTEGGTAVAVVVSRIKHFFGRWFSCSSCNIRLSKISMSGGDAFS